MPEPGGLRILGIDPGSRVVGYAVLETQGNRTRLIECGTLRVADAPDFPSRLLRIHKGLGEIILRTRPQEAAVEEVQPGKSFRSAEKLGEGRGVAILACAQAGLAVHEYSPTAVKKSVTGGGGAHKTQVVSMVQRLLSLTKPVSQDASDALAIALTHVYRRDIRGLPANTGTPASPNNAQIPSQNDPDLPS